MINFRNNDINTNGFQVKDCKITLYSYNSTSENVLFKVVTYIAGYLVFKFRQGRGQGIDKHATFGPIRELPEHTLSRHVTWAPVI